MNTTSQLNKKILRTASVSVIIINWNGGDLILKTISSLYKQSILPQEIIVIDNASSDHSEIQIKENFPLVKLIQSTENLGFAKANNLAVRESHSASKWIALLNPDAFAEPNWLETLLKAAEANSEYAVFGSRLMNAQKPVKIDGIGDIYHFSGLVWRSMHGADLTTHDLESKIKEIFSPCAAAAMYRKDAFLAAAGFDEEYFCYVEDVDLGFRLNLLGYKSCLVVDSVVLHVGSAFTGKRSDFSVYYGHRNLVWTFFKNMPRPLLLACLPIHIALNILSIIWFAFRGQGFVICKAKWDAILGLPKILKKRTVVQNSRTASWLDIWKILDKRIIRKPVSKRNAIVAGLLKR